MVSAQKSPQLWALVCLLLYWYRWLAYIKWLWLCETVSPVYIQLNVCVCHTHSNVCTGISFFEGDLTSSITFLHFVSFPLSHTHTLHSLSNILSSTITFHQTKNNNIVLCPLNFELFHSYNFCTILSLSLSHLFYLIVHTTLDTIALAIVITTTTTTSIAPTKLLAKALLVCLLNWHFTRYYSLFFSPVSIPLSAHVCWISRVLCHCAACLSYVLYDKMYSAHTHAHAHVAREKHQTKQTLETWRMYRSQSNSGIWINVSMKLRHSLNMLQQYCVSTIRLSVYAWNIWLGFDRNYMRASCTFAVGISPL